MRHCSVQPTAVKRGTNFAGLRGHGTGAQWQPGAGGMCLHTIILDPKDRERIIIGDLGTGCISQ